MKVLVRKEETVYLFSGIQITIFISLLQAAGQTAMVKKLFEIEKNNEFNNPFYPHYLDKSLFGELIKALSEGDDDCQKLADDLLSKLGLSRKMLTQQKKSWIRF